jgi:hypothetical protein
LQHSITAHNLIQHEIQDNSNEVNAPSTSTPVNEGEVSAQGRVGSKEGGKEGSKGREVETKFKECQRLLCAMFVMAQNYQVHPVYPSGTDDLEWRDPAPELDHKYPRSPGNQWNEVYYND